MPVYTFLNKETNEEFDVTMRMAELDDYKKANPHFQQVLNKMNLCDPILAGVSAKPPGGFREVLQEMKKKVPNNSINSF